MKISQGSLVLLPYPFSNLKGFKVRPALVVSNDLFNKNSGDCVMVPLTSVLRKGNYSVLVKSSDLSSGKLIKPSMVRSDKFFCADQNLVQMKIGELNNSTFKKIKKLVLSCF